MKHQYSSLPSSCIMWMSAAWMVFLFYVAATLPEPQTSTMFGFDQCSHTIPQVEGQLKAIHLFFLPRHNWSPKQFITSVIAICIIRRAYTDEGTCLAAEVWLMQQKSLSRCCLTNIGPNYGGTGNQQVHIIEYPSNYNWIYHFQARSGNVLLLILPWKCLTLTLSNNM